MGRFVFRCRGGRADAGARLARVLQVNVSVWEGLLTGVHLCLSLACSNGTVFVGEQNLFELTHFRSQCCHFVLQTHRKTMSCGAGSACARPADGGSPVAAGLCASAPRPSSPATTPKVSSSVCSGWLRRGSVPGTSASAHRGPAPLSSCGARLLLLQRRCCSSHLLALHGGSFPSEGGEFGA